MTAHWYRFRDKINKFQEPNQTRHSTVPTVVINRPKILILLNWKSWLPLSRNWMYAWMGWSWTTRWKISTNQSRGKSLEIVTMHLRKKLSLTIVWKLQSDPNRQPFRRNFEPQTWMSWARSTKASCQSLTISILENISTLTSETARIINVSWNKDWRLSCQRNSRLSCCFQLKLKGFKLIA